MNIPGVGNTWAVGLVFQTHLVIVAFIMGIAILSPVAESLGLRGGEYWSRLSYGLSLTIVRLFSFGATWAVLGLVLLFGLYPRLLGVLTSIFFWPLLVVCGIWLVMTISAYLYHYSWTRLAARRGLHIAIGWVFAGSTFVFISLITGLSSYQLTPTSSATALAAALNPSWSTEIVHRHVGNLSYAGLILGGYAGLRCVFWRGNDTTRAYHDWLGHVGLLLGVGLVLLQPIAGWFYARQVQVGSPGAYERMMVGDNAWMFLVQTFFLGIIFVLGNIYLAAAIKRGRRDSAGRRWVYNLTWGIGVLALLGIVPKEWPLGQMTPWKYISLVGLVLFSTVNLVLYLKARRDFVWGQAGRIAHLALAALAVAAVAMMVTMGVIRTSARGGDTIYNRLGQEQSQQLGPP